MPLLERTIMKVIQEVVDRMPYVGLCSIKEQIRQAFLKLCIELLYRDAEVEIVSRTCMGSRQCAIYCTENDTL